MKSSLHEIALACHSGACNHVGLLNSLADALKETPADLWRGSLDLKYVIGHVSFLLGESLGPSEATVREFSQTIESGE